MELRNVLDQLLQSGKELADRGKELAEDKLDIPESGPNREAMISGLKKGAAAGGILALLLGSRAGRRLSGKAIKLGGVAALGTLAYKAYQDWNAKQGREISDQPLPELVGPTADERSLQLVRAMVAAAKADGHLDAQEMTNIRQQIDELGLEGDLEELLLAELAKPLDAKAVAAGARSPASAAETYLASFMVIDVNSDVERRYLNDLAAALGISDDYRGYLEASVS